MSAATGGGSDAVVATIKYLRKRGILTARRLARRPAAERRMLRMFEDRGISEPILLAGFEKSGNTWLRLLLFNYFHILETGAERTLTFDELNEIQCHRLGEPPAAPFRPGYPPLYWTHRRWAPVFRAFRVIYVYRHPLDALISYYHWQRERPTPFSAFPPHRRRGLHDPDRFVSEVLSRWLRHFLATEPRSDFPVSYEELKEDARGVLAGLLKGLGYPPDPTAVERSVRLSAFDNVRRMARETGQTHGIARAGKLNPDFEFLRSGRTRQWERVLRPETVAELGERLAAVGLAERFGLAGAAEARLP